jgi:hypothetical protein
MHVADVVEVVQHWPAGRPLRAITLSQGLDRNTVRKSITAAREAGVNGIKTDIVIGFAVCKDLVHHDYRFERVFQR